MKKLKGFLALAAFVVVALVFWRGVDFGKCGIASYDLKRDTEFSWVTGNCMVERTNGERIYLNQMRGMEGGE